MNTRSKSRCYFDSEKATTGQGQIWRQAEVATSFPLSSAHEFPHIGVEPLRLFCVGKVQTHLARLQHTHVATDMSSSGRTRQISHDPNQAEWLLGKWWRMAATLSPTSAGLNIRYGLLQAEPLCQPADIVTRQIKMSKL